MGLLAVRDSYQLPRYWMGLLLMSLAASRGMAWQPGKKLLLAQTTVERAHRMVVSSFDLLDKKTPQQQQRQQKFSTLSFSTSSASKSSSETPLVLDPLVVCGPSGVGKGTIIQRFQEDFPELAHNFGFTVSHTTRAPRPGEMDGVHYHFVSMEEMKSMLAAGAFLESAQVHTNYYGTSWQSLRRVQQEGKRCLLDIDVQGVQRLKLLQHSWKTARATSETDASSASLLSKANGSIDVVPTPSFVLQPKYLFIAPPALETLQDRLRARNTETPQALQTRLANAAAEVAYGNTAGNFDATVVNDKLDRAVQDFAAAVRRLYNFL